MKHRNEELDKLKSVQYRMREEGFHYCFKHYSNFNEIDDSFFHQLRQNYLLSADMLETYINKCVQILENEEMNELN